MKKYLKTAPRVLWILLNNAYCIPTYLVWVYMLLPLKFINEGLYWEIEGRLYHWLLCMVAYWGYSAGYHIQESGDDIEEVLNEPTLVLVNHQSTSDVPLLMQAFTTRSKLVRHMAWVMDAVFQYTNFGLVSKCHGDFFIESGREKREAAVEELKKFLVDVFVPRERNWMVLFPEGGFLRKRKEASKRYALKNKLPNLEHVTLPRMGAIQSIIDTIGPRKLNNNGNKCTGRLKYVIDLTVAYPQGEPLDLGVIMTGHRDPCVIHFDYKVFPIEKVPTDPESFKNWLFSLYVMKNERLGDFYKTGVWDHSKKDQKNFTSAPEEDQSDLIGEAQEDRENRDDPNFGFQNGSLPSMGNDNPSHKFHENESYLRSKNLDTQANAMENPSECSARDLSIREVKHDLLQMMLMHSFFIMSSVFHLACLKVCYSHFSG